MQSQLRGSLCKKAILSQYDEALYMRWGLSTFPQGERDSKYYCVGVRAAEASPEEERDVSTLDGALALGLGRVGSRP